MSICRRLAGVIEFRCALRSPWSIGPKITAGFTYLHTVAPAGVASKNHAGPSTDDYRIAVGQPPRAGEPARQKVRGIRGGISPDRLGRAVADSAAVLPGVAVADCWRRNFHYRRVVQITPLVLVAVVENKDVAGPIRLRIAPVLQQIAALATIVPGVPGGLFGNSTMVNNPDCSHNQYQH